MENLDLEALLECYGKLPEVNEEVMKEYTEIVKKLKMFVKAAEETGSSPEAASAAKVIMVAVDGIYREVSSRAYTATMKHALSDLKDIKDQLAQQDSKDLESIWTCIHEWGDKFKKTCGIDTSDIRQESRGNPMQGLESVEGKLKGMHQGFIARQIEWQMGLSAILGLQTLFECWTTFSILNDFSIDGKSRSRYDKKLQQAIETLSDAEKRGQPIMPDDLQKLLDKLERATEQLDDAKELLQENKSNVSARRTVHIIGSVSSLVATYRSISEYFMAASAGLNPFHQAMAVASAAICGVSAIAHGAMVYKCQKAIAQADALLGEIKAYEKRLASAVKNTEEFLCLLDKKIKSASKLKSPTKPSCQQGQGTSNATVLQVVIVVAILAVVWGYLTGHKLP